MGKQVGKYIQQLRQAHGLGLRQLGTQAGLSHSYLSMIEHGHREVSIATLYSLIRELDGNFLSALHLLALDAGVPEEEMVDCTLGGNQP